MYYLHNYAPTINILENRNNNRKKERRKKKEEEGISQDRKKRRRNKRNESLPVNDVGQEIVVPQPVVHVHLLIVDGQGAGADATLVLLGRVSAKLPREHLEDLLPHPPALRERGEGEVIRVHFPQPCGTQQHEQRFQLKSRGRGGVGHRIFVINI